MSTTHAALGTRHCSLETPLGRLAVLAHAGELEGLYFPGHWTRPDRRGFGPEVSCAEDPVLAAASEQLNDYFAGRRQIFDLRFSAPATALQARLRELLEEVPYGRTTTYGSLAARLGGIDAREVGALVGANPLSIFVPCHRVIGANCKLTGYAGGMARKQHLLDLERGQLQADVLRW